MDNQSKRENQYTSKINKQLPEGIIEPNGEEVESVAGGVGDPGNPYPIVPPVPIYGGGGTRVPAGTPLLMIPGSGGLGSGGLFGSGSGG